ncbi:MAG: hypothetical protein EBS94_13620, partial [Proteobacteria bacterium]|nr:hypothetical protein [Pseudomonadota bacterium]
MMSTARLAVIKRLVASVAIVLQGLLPALAAVPATPVYAEGATVTSRALVTARATKTTISLDKSSASGGDNQCTTLTTTSKAEGPALTESTAGQLAAGTFVYLKAPTGFEFCSPSGTTTAVVSKAGSASTNLTLDDGTDDGTVAAEPTLSGTDTLTVTIKVSSA